MVGPDCRYDIDQRVRTLHEQWCKCRARYNEEHSLADLECCIDALSEALSLPHTHDSDRPSPLVALDSLTGELHHKYATCLRDRYAHTGDLEDLQQAAKHLDAALVDPACTSRMIAQCRCEAGHTYFKMFSHSGNMANLETAFTTLVPLLELCPPGHPVRPQVLYSLGRGFQVRFTHKGTSDDLSRCIELQEELISITEPESIWNIWGRYTLGCALRFKYTQTSDVAVIQQAVDLHYSTLHDTRPSHPDYYMAQYALGVTLRIYYGVTHNTGHLEESLQTLRDACRRISLRPHHPENVVVRLNVAAALGTLFGTKNNIEALQEGIDMLRPVLPSPHPASPWVHTQLAWLLTAKYNRFLLEEDLDESIEVNRHTIRRMSNSPLQALHMLNFGLALSERSLARNSIDDCREAIEVYHKALDYGPCTFVANALNINLAGSLKNLWTFTRDDGLLDEAVRLCKEWQNVLRKRTSADLRERYAVSI